MIQAPILNLHGESLDFRFARATGGTPHPGWLVILAHGVTGNLDRPVIADTAAALNAAGFDTLRFSFAGNGDSEGEFRAATISKEFFDLLAVIDAAIQQYPKIAVVGHSMGAAVAVVAAAGNSRISALVSLAGMVDTMGFAETEFGHIDPDVGLMWDEPGCPLSCAFMVDLCDTIVNVSPQAELVMAPWLLVHGTADDVVLPEDTESIVALRGDAVTAHFIEGADHSFSAPDHKAEMLRIVTEWLSSKAAG
ncbi:MAG: alpha/beta hydrolase family protein [Luteolibacter sp.]|jgi:uncharacterized protein